MQGVKRIMLIAAGVLVALVVLVIIGLRIQPSPFPAYAAGAPSFDTVPVPDGLPEPVERFYRTAFGDEVPVITSAVITGRADLTIGTTFPSRLRFTHDAGQGYRHYIESTVWGFPLMKVNERYVDDVGRMELPFGTTEDEPKVNSAANLGLWGESIWLSPVYLTDERVRWEPIDATHARMIVPFEGTGEDEFTVTFDPETGLITRMEAMRWKNADSTEKTRWLLDVSGWGEFHGVPVPVDSQVTWEDDGKPWLIIRVEDIAYNVDVSQYIQARGL